MPIPGRSLSLAAAVLASMVLSTPMALAADGSSGFLELVDRLRNDSHWKARLEAAVLLGRSGDYRARRPLTRALVDPHYAVRVGAIRGLVRLDDVRAVRPIIDALGDDEPFMRIEAKRALDHFDLETSRPYLIRALRRHPSALVRLGASERLAASRHPDSLSAFLDATGHDDEVGRFAVSVLRALPEPQAIDWFMRGLGHPDYRVQIRSIEALADMEAQPAAAPLIRLLDSRVPEVTIAAAEGLRSLSQYIDRREIFVAALRSENRFRRARAMKVLGVLGGEEAIRLLLGAMDDPDLLVRGAAVSALSSVGDLRAIPKLRAMRKREENARIISLVRTTLANLERARADASATNR